MTKLIFHGKLKTWGEDYPVDNEGNRIPNTGVKTYHLQFYITQSSQNGKRTLYGSPHEHLPLITMRLDDVSADKIKKALIYSPTTVTVEFEEDIHGEQIRPPDA